MAGLARTNNFMLGTATVMLGPMDQLFDLNSEEHSIGLVKNFTLLSEPAYTELTQGVQNTVVFSVLTANPVRATMEAYEFTAQNFAYALGLQGSKVAYDVKTEVTADTPGGSPGTTTITVDSATDFAEGDYIMIDLLGFEKDTLIVRKIEGILGDALTLDRAIKEDIPGGAIVTKVHGLDVGSKSEQEFYAAKIAGRLANGEPVVMLLPKIRIVNGFNVAFTTDDFNNLPLEFTVYDQVRTDPYYSEFQGTGARMFKA